MFQGKTQCKWLFSIAYSYVRHYQRVGLYAIRDSINSTAIRSVTRAWEDLGNLGRKLQLKKKQPDSISVLWFPSVFSG